MASSFSPARRPPLADGAQFDHLHREYKGVYMSLPEARAETKDARRQARTRTRTHMQMRPHPSRACTCTRIHNLRLHQQLQP